ncbi:unnamed protein product [Cunninghamella blakesleeana]
MKVLHLLFIFILNFKLIFCQIPFPQGRFTISNLDDQYLTAGSDNPFVEVLNQPLNDYSKWMASGDSLINVGTRLVLQVNGDLRSGSQLVTASEIQGSFTQAWHLTPFEDGYIIVSASQILVIGSYPGNEAALLVPRNGNPYQKWFIRLAQ